MVHDTCVHFKSDTGPFAINSNEEEFSVKREIESCVRRRCSLGKTAFIERSSDSERGLGNSLTKGWKVLLLGNVRFKVSVDTLLRTREF